MYRVIIHGNTTHESTHAELTPAYIARDDIANSGEVEGLVHVVDENGFYICRNCGDKSTTGQPGDLCKSCTHSLTRRADAVEPDYTYNIGSYLATIHHLRDTGVWVCLWRTTWKHKPFLRWMRATPRTAKAQIDQEIPAKYR